MNNPFNQLPISAEWLRKSQAAVTRAAEDTGCTVVMVVIQPDGTIGVASSGVPDTGLLADLLESMPNFFLTMAGACAVNDDYENAATRS